MPLLPTLLVQGEPAADPSSWMTVCPEPRGADRRMWAAALALAVALPPLEVPAPDVVYPDAVDRARRVDAQAFTLPFESHEVLPFPVYPDAVDRIRQRADLQQAFAWVRVEPTPTPPVPPLPPHIPVVGGGGGTWPLPSDRLPDPPPALYELTEAVTPKSTVRVRVHATFLAVEVVERGNLVFFTATFDGEPDSVYFSFIAPGESRPRVDPGFGAVGSCLSRIDAGTYVAVLDTTGLRGGVLKWHLWSEGAARRSAFGEVTVKPRPAALL